MVAEMEAGFTEILTGRTVDEKRLRQIMVLVRLIVRFFFNAPPRDDARNAG